MQIAGCGNILSNPFRRLESVRFSCTGFSCNQKMPTKCMVLESYMSNSLFENLEVCIFNCLDSDFRQPQDLTGLNVGTTCP